MPRPTKMFTKLTKEVNPDLFTSEENQEKMKVFSQLLEQYGRTKHSDRKKKYKQQLTTVFQRLCLQIDDGRQEVTNSEKEIASLQQRLKQKHKAVEKAQEREVRLQCRLDKAHDWETMYRQQRQSNRTQNSEYSALLRENEALESKLQTLKKRLEKLQAKK